MIDTTFQEKLMSALKDAVAFYNDGATPTDSVIKSAQDHSFNIDQTQRLVETFNTARTIHHFRKNAQTDCKAKEFELADNDKVVLALFNKPEVKEAYMLNDNYAKKPRNYNNPDFELPPVKVADFVDTDLNTQITRAQKYIRSTEQLLKDAYDKASAAFAKTELMVTSIADMLKRGTADVCKDRATRLFLSTDTKDDMTNLYLMDGLSKQLPAYMTPTHDDLAKYGAVVDDRDLSELKGLIKNAADLYQTAMQLIVQHNNLSTSLQKFKDDFNKLAGERQGSGLDNFFLKQSDLFDQFGRPIPQTVSQPTKPQSTKTVSQSGSQGGGQGGRQSKQEDKQPRKSDEGFLSKLESGILSGALSTGGKKVESGISDLFAYQTKEDNKRISGRLNNLQRTTILQDLIINDPVISEVDPKVTAQAYNTIMELAPEVSLSKEVVRAVLRQSVHALATSPYDAAQWVELEKKIKEVKGTMPAQKKFEGGQK